MIGRLRGLPAAALVLGAVAVAAVARSTDGRYVGDNRFDQYWAPGWRLLRETSLWDGTRGMGRVGEEIWPLTAPLALLRALGLSPIAAQQVWHATVLTLAGLGVVVLLRTVQPRVGPTHVVAGLAYALSPYAITFLVPTNLFWSYVVAPWLLAVARLGLRGDRPWRWAAAWALLVASGGDTDPPSLLLAAAWVVPLAVVAVAVEREATWRSAGGWLARAVALTVWVELAALVKVGLGSGPLAQRLLTTEGVVEVNQTSSWSESWRGLGYWITYFGTPGRDGDIPGAVAWFETLPGVLLAFAVPVVALVAVARLRWPQRVLWGGLAVLSVAIMVGSNPSALGGRSPLGRLLLEVYDRVPSLASFRTTYKAGSGLLVAVAVLAATGASAWGTALARRDTRLRHVPLAALAVVVLATAIPLWSGRLYADDRQVEAIAPHWIEAADWIESQPGDARVLVLPGSTQTAYRWGWVGDDILDTLFRRHPNVVPTNFPVSTPLTADIVDALARRLDEGRLDAAELAAVARRLGVGWVIVRNDLDWARLRVPRPDDLTALRDSEDLPLVETFGEPGEDTTAAADDSRVAAREAELPPLEVYEVPGVEGHQPLARSAEAPLLVEGGGDAWPVLADLGLLDDERPLAFAGSRTDSDLADALTAGSPLVVTDTNRRRLTLIRGPGPVASEVLPAEGDPGPVSPADLFGRSGTQTVATYGDAVAIETTGEAGLGGATPWFRPANAFDRDLASSWRTGGQRDPVGDAVTLTLAESHPISRVAVTPVRPDGRLRRVTAVDVVAGGQTRRVELGPSGEGVATWATPVDADEVEIRIAAVEGDGNAAVGLAEVAVEGVDAQERIVLPTRATDTSEAASAPIAYVLTRSGVEQVVEQARFEEERVLRRQLDVAGDRSLEMTGVVRGGRDLPDQAVDAIVGGEIGAWGSSRPTLPSEGRGGLALDGDPATGWVGRAGKGEQLTVRFPTRDVATVTVRVGGGASDVPLDEVLATVGDDDPQPVALTPEEGCDTGCDRVGTVTLDAGPQERVVVRIPVDDPGSRRVRILEVEVDGADGPLPRVSEGPGDGEGCGTGVVAVDGEPVPLRLADAEGADALDGEAVSVRACDPVALDAGTHTVDALAGARVDTLVLATDDVVTDPADGAVTGRAAARGPGRLDVVVEGDEPAVVVTGQSYDAGWTATIDGRSLGTPAELDGQAGWVVPAGADRRVELRFAPQGTYRVALALSALGVAVCLVLLLRPVRRIRQDDET
ncbi:MAG TPA: alpha-(1-_3)-arabinofuranosyltransferase family protein [Iamia sp.]